jgi:hypothetical protein
VCFIGSSSGKSVASPLISWDTKMRRFAFRRGLQSGSTGLTLDLLIADWRRARHHELSITVLARRST